jgi:hypothetical protein
MTPIRTTIWEAARDRFAEWAQPVARSQDGSRSLPGSRRNTDQDIWYATNGFVAADKSRCGSASAETARLGREDVSITDRWSCVRDLLEVRRRPHPHLLGLHFFAWFPKGGDTGVQPVTREIGKTKGRAPRGQGRTKTTTD